MARKTSKDITQNDKFIFMCLKCKSAGYSMEFDKSEPALNYIENLNDKNIEWYGLYKVDHTADTLRPIVTKRLKQYN